MKAPSAPRSASTWSEPSFQSIAKIRLVGGSTAVASMTLPNAFVWPARTLPTASTPGVFAAACATLTGIGVKLFWAVTA